MNRNLGISFVAIVLAGITACHKVEAVHEEKPTTPAHNPLEVSLTPDLEKRIRVGDALIMAVSTSFTVSGRVEADETREARVGTPITGRITDLLVREGDLVKKGQVLATLSSTELTNLQFSFLKAHSQVMLSQRAVDRAQQLLDAGVIGSAELQRRQAELSQATAEVSTLRGQLKVLGMPEAAADNLETTRAVNSTSQIVASIDGIVLERKTTVGQVVQPADTIFLLADLSRVWLEAEVPEQTAGNLAEGQLVQAEISSLPGQVVRGRLTHVHSILNPETRTVKVHMDVDNPRGRLKPGMLATMTLKEPAATRRVIPITAVVRENNQEFVFGQSGSNTFTMREVALGPEFENMRVLESGLEPNEKLVLDGAFHLNNERKRLALQKGIQ
jgi:membrane fusion protein, heavy metal efflux system